MREKKTYLLFTLAQVSHEEKYFAEKEVLGSKYFFFGWCQNIHIVSPSLWHNILILWAWATMYEFNLHNILCRKMCLSLERDFLLQRTLICFDYDSNFFKLKFMDKELRRHFKISAYLQPNPTIHHWRLRSWTSSR